MISLEKKILGKSAVGNVNVSRKNTLNESHNPASHDEIKYKKNAMYATPKTGNFPKVDRVEDETLSDSSIEDMGHKEHIDEIQQFVIQHNQFSISLDVKNDSLQQPSEHKVNMDPIELSDEGGSEDELNS